MNKIITNALIRKDNRLTVEVGDLCSVMLPTGEAVVLVNLGFKGINGFRGVSILNPDQYEYVGEKPVLEVHLKDRTHPVYCKRIDSVSSEFDRLESHSGKRCDMNRNEIEHIRYKKLVEVKYQGESFFFLLSENAVISNRSRALEKMTHTAASIENGYEVINGL